MIISYVFLDANGIPTGGGSNRQLPEGAIPLPPPFTTMDLPRLRYHDGVWTLRDLPAPSPPTAEETAAIALAQLAIARTRAVETVNKRAGDLRKRIYTDIAGQDTLYLEKRAEAVAYVAATEVQGEPLTLEDYPLIENEVGITAPTPWQLAQIWLHRSDQFKSAGAATERLRMRALIAVDAAPDFDALDTILADFTEALDGLPI
ncbi:MAG: hypothetical protein ACLGIE_09405 [Alphaproteobacteria bacterium]